MRYNVADPLPGVYGEARNREHPARFLRHPLYAWLGLRPAAGQHTREEHVSLRRWAAGRSCLVEIGVAEGVSALALRETMDGNGTLYLVDPFHLSRAQALNFMKRTAHRTVNGCRRGRVKWIQQFSYEAVHAWQQPIDLLLIDGDHEEAAVERDWNLWSIHIRIGGVALFHDARLFKDGWTTPEYGPVKVVNRLFRERGTPVWSIAEELDSLVVVKRNA